MGAMALQSSLDQRDGHFFSLFTTARRGTVAVGLLMLMVMAGLSTANEEKKLCDQCSCSETLLNCTEIGLQILPITAEAWPTNVEEALFDHNNLLSIIHIPPLPKLRRLSFRHNSIQVIQSDAFCNLTALEILDLGSNQLSRPKLDADIFRGPYMAGEYKPLTNLTVLYLDSNSIHSLGSDFFEHVTHIRELSLAFNPIRVIDTPTLQAISSLPNLQWLDLTHVGVSVLPPYLLHTLMNLTTLNISANQFVEVPEELTHAHQLRELVLSSNPIRFLIQGSFPPSLESLQVLEMNYMSNLTFVGPGGLAALKGLRVLRIMHSKTLTQIHPDAFVGADEIQLNATYPHLDELVLRGNKLRTLHPDLIARWDELKVLDLEDNKWLCDCELSWAVFELEPIINRTHPDLLRNFICVDPEPMRGNSIFSLHVRNYHLRCLDADGAHPERDGHILVGVLVGVLLAVPATLAAVLCWRRGGFGWFSTGPASYSRAFYRRAENIDDF